MLAASRRPMLDGREATPGGGRVAAVAAVPVAPVALSGHSGFGRRTVVVAAAGRSTQHAARNRQEDELRCGVARAAHTRDGQQ